MLCDITNHFLKTSFQYIWLFLYKSLHTRRWPKAEAWVFKDSSSRGLSLGWLSFFVIHFLSKILQAFLHPSCLTSSQVFPCCSSPPYLLALRELEILQFGKSQKTAIALLLTEKKRFSFRLVALLSKRDLAPMEQWSPLPTSKTPGPCLYATWTYIPQVTELQPRELEELACGK